MYRHKELVLLDLDGTMVDTVPDLAVAIDAMQTQLGLPARGEDRTRLWVGNGMDRLVKRALTDGVDGEPEAALFERAYPLFLEAYAARPCVASCFYPGVETLLDHLKRGGYKVGCITNKTARVTDQLLRLLGIYDNFDIILSGDSLTRRKPDPLPLLHAGEQLGVTSDKTLMIGDSQTDVDAARAAGIDIVCVSYGYNRGRDIRDADPDRVVDSLVELLGDLPPAAAA